MIYIIYREEVVAFSKARMIIKETNLTCDRAHATASDTCALNRLRPAQERAGVAGILHASC